ncbi:MAG TPA: molybdopterin-dependent oxidoreductase [Terracidiphilus sp.]|jgi:hypothetical protein
MTRITLVLLAAAVVSATAAHPQQPASAPPQAEGQPGQMHHGTHPPVLAGPLKITFGEKSSEWTAEKLAALPHLSITVYNEHAKATQTYSGVPLIELLKPLGVPDKPRGKDFRLYLIVEGSDGYQVIYSVAEATPDVHDATVLVADAMDGKPLGDNGPIQLVATGEKRPARWVRNLVSIQVKTAE